MGNTPDSGESIRTVLIANACEPSAAAPDHCKLRGAVVGTAVLALIGVTALGLFL